MHAYTSDNHAMAELASLFGAPFRQEKRLLRLSFPHADAPGITDSWGRTLPVQLVVERLDALESLSRPFEYTVLLLADSAHLTLEDLLGRLLAVSLVRPDGTLRWFTGHVCEFALEGSDAGIARYRAILRPWLWYFTLQQSNRLFLGKNVRQITEAVLQEHRAIARWQTRVRGDDPTLTMSVQGAGQGESSANYLTRLWEARGWAYRWEHDEAGHCLVLMDDTASQCPATDGQYSHAREDRGFFIRFQAQGGGHFVNVASVAAHQVWPTTAVYSATKYAVWAITEGIRQEHPDIRATIISPGVVESELADTITDPTTAAAIQEARKVALKADVIAQAIRYAIEQPPEVGVGEIVVRPMGGAF